DQLCRNFLMYFCFKDVFGCVYCALFPSTEAPGLKIQNKLLGKCLQVQGSRVSLAACSSSSAFQEWLWLPEHRALHSQHTGECLTAPGEQYEGVRLRPCISLASSQSWYCSKKGHLTSMGSGLHLSATQESTLVFLSREHKQVRILQRAIRKSFAMSVRLNHNHILKEHISFMWKGMGWKITMLVLSSLALVLGIVILILNVYSNRKKVVCVLKSYTPRLDVSVPGSPVPSERAPLTEHTMRLPHSSPTLQRGEILIEWNDGTVTPLYEA
uniref:Ricin B lectin domain-containing protein n=1 Tax=Mola mola TaxID=94237 RepID=A0A3Q3VZX7_MOLML